MFELARKWSREMRDEAREEAAEAGYGKFRTFLWGGIVKAVAFAIAIFLQLMAKAASALAD